MTTKPYIVISTAGANLRQCPSTTYPTTAPVRLLAQGTAVEVIADWTMTNTVGSETKYLPVLVDGEVLYCAASLLAAAESEGNDMSKLIADVSSNNGTINFTAMAQKVSGVIIRAGYRGYSGGTVQTDSAFPVNIDAAEAAGLPVGVYWYTTAISDAEACAEADKLLELIKGHELSFPVFLDLEYAPERKGRADKLTAAQRTQYAVTWLERVRAAGYPVGVYCNPDFWSGALDNSKLQGYARWIARYGSSCSVDCDMWQYTSTAKGSIYGASSAYLDLSHCFTDFIGGAKSKFAGDTPATTTTGGFDMSTLSTIKSGSTGAEVKSLQLLLNGKASAGLTVDGIFGTKTEVAVRAYQEANGLTVDGIVGVNTWGKLLAA